MLARCLAEGFAFQGEVSSHTGAPRGEPSGQLLPTSFVICLQNHDQIGNRAMGERLTALAHPDALRAATAMLLLTPQIPLLFMGEEWGAETPFLFFTDHHGELAELVRQGRRREFAKFAAFADPQRRESIPDPNAAATFEASRADLKDAEQQKHAAWLALYRALLAIRARDITPHMKSARSIGAEALDQVGVRASWRLDNGAVLTIAANFGATALSMRYAGRNSVRDARHTAGQAAAEQLRGDGGARRDERQPGGAGRSGWRRAALAGCAWRIPRRRRRNAPGRA